MNNEGKDSITKEEINRVKKIFESCREFIPKGNVADYIPELAKVDKNLYGAYIVQENGDDIMLGDYDVKFTMQSVSKVIILTRALLDVGMEELLKKVSFEPTDYGFNSIVNLELKNDNRPLNPLINAGAIVCTSLIKGDAAQRVCELVRLLADNPDIGFDEDTFRSENETGSRNRALAYFMHSNGVLEGDVEEILAAYFKICAIEVTCKDLANISYVIANNGVNKRNERLLDERNCVRLRTVMALCGMYDASGKFAMRVGIPSKSGVSGGIMSVAYKYRKFGIGSFGPSLDEVGNSYPARKFLEKINEEFELSIF